MSQKTYLVTGGTGFIGSALVRRLVRDGHAVRVVDNDLRGHAERLSDLSGSIELIPADVRNVDALTAAARGCDSILHLAALNGTENFYNRPELVLDVGVLGMHAALSAAKQAGVREFVLASSSEVYQTPHVVPTPENEELKIPDPWNPRYSYAGSKLISEIMLANYHRDHFKRVIIFRPHNVYGPDMGWEHVLPQFILRAKEQVERTPRGPVPFPIQGDGQQTRSFIYIDDFIDALLLLLQHGAHRNLYHLGTMDEVPIEYLARLVVHHFGREAMIEPGSSPVGSTPRRCPDTRKIQALGFKPSVPLSEGVSRTAEWYVANASRRPAA